MSGLVPVRLKFEGADDFLRAYTEDVALGGVFVATASAVPVGTSVDLSIELAPGRGLRVQAEVAWQRSAGPQGPAGVGLHFTEVSEQHRQWLAGAVKDYEETHGLKARLRAEHQLRTATAGAGLSEATFEVGSVELLPDDGSVLGIDLGTSNSCACVMRDGSPVMIPMGEGGDGTVVPSVVAYDDLGNVTVGRAALEDISRNARRTIFGSKRFIGRQYDHPDVHKMLGRYPYKVVPGPGGKVAVDINGKKVNLVSVSAKILAHIVERAEDYLKRPVRRAIITVPAYYNQNQRHAVTQAGRLAGLTVERIINEPTAAAVAYGLTYQKPRLIVVYDLGGGTFDVSVMRVGEAKLTVLATAGDTFLGGEDFDNAIVEHVCQVFASKHGKELSRNHTALAVVKVACERAKQRLSLHERSMVTLREVVVADGTKARLEVEVERKTVERLVEPLVTRTLEITDMAIHQAAVGREEIDDIILVGGQTMMPYVQKCVADHFGRAPRKDLRPDEVVAMGAGMISSLGQSGAELEDVLSISIGLGEADGKFVRVIPRNTKVPTRASHMLRVPRSELKRFQLPVYQGESEQCSRNELLGHVPFKEFKAGRVDPVKFRVDLVLTPDCLLKVRVCQEETEQEIDVLLDTADTGRVG